MSLLKDEWSDYGRAAMERYGVQRIAEELGIVFTKNTPNEAGWLECYSWERDEENPSAAINVASNNGILGRCTDLGSGKDSTSIWDLAARLGKFASWQDARKHYADLAGIEPPKQAKAKKSSRSKPAGEGLAGAVDIFPPFPDDRMEDIHARRYCEKRPGYTLESFKAFNPRRGSWPPKQSGWGVYIFSAFNIEQAPPTLRAHLIYRQDAKPFAAYGSLPERKAHVVKGSSDGIIFPGTIETFLVSEVFVKFEGLPDAIATSPFLPAGWAAFTNAMGVNSIPPIGWLKSKTLIIFAQADEPGIAGARKFAAAAIQAGAIGVKIVQAPYEITPSHGKDWRDAVSEGQITTERIREMIDQAPIVTAEDVADALPQGRRKKDAGGDGKIEPISNVDEWIDEKSDGKQEVKKDPLPLSMITEDILTRTSGWPRRVGGVLFVDDPEHGHADIESPAALFAYLAHSTGALIKWHNFTGCVSQAEQYQHLRRTAKAYTAVERLPHSPTIPGHYYASSCSNIKPGDGSTLDKFLARFSPATDIDADLIKALFVTPAWGGDGGTRPAFAITSDAGRGAGKSKLIDLLGFLYLGVVPLSVNEDAALVRQRLLSPEAISKRIVCLDNVKSHRLSSADLEGLITSPVISGKRLYVGEFSRPNTLTWCMTLNGISLSTDIAQRCVVIKLQKPTYSPTFFEDAIDFISTYREEMIGDALAFLQSERFQLAKYSRWGAWERDILCRLPDPTWAQRVILERQKSSDVECEEGELIEDYFSEKLAWLNFKPDEEIIRIPSEIVCQWYCESTNEKHKAAVAVSRIIGQMINEGTIKRLEKSPSRTHGRCFLWVGEKADRSQEPKGDVLGRIEDRKPMTFTVGGRK